MCFQTFVHHACGHPKLIDAPCFLAADNPFYVKVQCPRYQHESTYPASSCGVGEYYCGRAEKDGWLLDALHLRSAEWDAAFNIACQKMTALDQHIAYFHATADRSGVSGEARWGHRGFAILSDAQQRLEDEKQHAAAEGAEVNKVIEKAKEWYRLNLLKKQMQAGPAVQPPFVPQSGLRPLELEATSPLGPAFQGIPMAAPPVYLTQQDWSILQNRQSVRQPSLLMPPSEGVSTQVDPVCRDSGNVELEAKKTMPASTGRKTLPTITPLARSGPVSNSYQAGAAKKDSGADSSSHRDRPRKKTSTSAAPVAPPAEIDMTNVRRSTRTRKKKVRYAESQGSSPSRDSSPDKKSEPAEKSASEWSELSSSPEKLQEKQGKLQRGSSGRFIKHSNRSSGESLASKIGEYQRRAGKTNGLTAGKSTMKRSVGVAGGQMATQQGAPYMSRGPTNKAWYAQPSEHYQTMLKGGAAELVAPRLGKSISSLISSGFVLRNGHHWADLSVHVSRRARLLVHRDYALDG